VSHVPYNVEDGRVPLAELGSYATIGSLDGWAIRPDADGTVEVRSPFVGLYFGGLPEEDRDPRQTARACQALRRHDRDIYEHARSSRNPEADLRDAFARRAGAALWLYRRDLRRSTYACDSGGVAAGWTLHPRCRGYNSDAHEVDLTVGTRTGKELDVHLGMHVCERGVFRKAGYVEVLVYHDGGAVQTVGTFSQGRSDLDKALHAEMVSLACRLAEERQVAAVAREQARLDHLRSRLALVPNSGLFGPVR
jgi:hypothetical protein